MVATSSVRLSCCLLLMAIGFISVYALSSINTKEDLHDSGAFVISSYDDYDDSENEMIQPEDVQRHVKSVPADDAKYEPLHSYVARRNRQLLQARASGESSRNVRRLHRTNLDARETTKSKSAKNFETHEKHKKRDNSEDEDNEPIENSTEAKLDKPTAENPDYSETTKDELDATDASISSETSDYDEKTSREETTAAPSVSTQVSEGDVESTVESTTATTTTTEKTTTEDMYGATDDYDDYDDYKDTDAFEVINKSKTTESPYEAATTKAMKKPPTKVATPETIAEATTSRGATSKESATTRKSTKLIDKNNTAKATAKHKATTKKSTTTTKEEEETTLPMMFEKIMPEYSFEIEDVKSDNFTYNFTDDEIERSLKRIMKKTLDVKKPKNCSAYTGSKYSIQAIECAISDLKNAKNRTEVNQILWKCWKIARIWICVYLIVVVPCWCQTGWCCCCCRCEFCFPGRIMIREKKYFSVNPPGVLVDPLAKDKKEAPIEYEPTIFEEDAYEKFESAIRNL